MAGNTFARASIEKTSKTRRRPSREMLMRSSIWVTCTTPAEAFREMMFRPKFGGTLPLLKATKLQSRIWKSSPRRWRVLP